MTTPTFPPAGYNVVSAPTFYQQAPVSPGINTSTVAAVTAPAFPATTAAVANTTGVDVVVYALAGAAGFTVVKVNGVTTGLVTAASASTTVYLPAGATISFTYASGTPSWVWVAV
jgi:hypothetical protein